MGKVFLAVFLLASPAAYGGSGEPPAMPGKFTCAIVRGLYRANKEQHTKEEMKNYLRALGFSEARIMEAERCLR